MSKPHVTVVGITGPSGSGKSWLAEKLCKALNDSGLSAVLLREDDFYKDRPDLCDSERAALNYDHPDAFDHGALRNALESLQAGEETPVPKYDYANHRRLRAPVSISPADIVIAEGILLLHTVSIRELCSITAFVNTPYDICLVRRVRRDTAERSRSIESVLSQYETSVRPMLLQFVEPQRAAADCVFNNSDQLAVTTLTNAVIEARTLT